MMSAISANPVASAFARSAMATLPPASRSPMMPEPTTAASKSAVPIASATADLIQGCLVDVSRRQGEQKIDASCERREGLLERRALFRDTALYGCGIGYAPVALQRMARPH